MQQRNLGCRVCETFLPQFSVRHGITAFAYGDVIFFEPAKENEAKERLPCIFLDPALRIYKGVEVTRFAQTDFNSDPLFIYATRRR
jgi:hypothetical protein